jgi:hypothetical protein
VGCKENSTWRRINSFKFIDCKRSSTINNISFLLRKLEKEELFKSKARG